MSLVAWSTTIAQVWRRTCGETCLPRSVEHCRSAVSVAPQNVSDTPTTEGHTSGIHKKLRGCDGSSNGQPGAKCHSRRFPKRQRTFATAFAPHADARRLGCDIIDAQTD